MLFFDLDSVVIPFAFLSLLYVSRGCVPAIRKVPSENKANASWKKKRSEFNLLLRKMQMYLYALDSFILQGFLSISGKGTSSNAPKCARVLCWYAWMFFLAASPHKFSTDRDCQAKIAHRFWKSLFMKVIHGQACILYMHGEITMHAYGLTFLGVYGLNMTPSCPLATLCTLWPGNNALRSRDQWASGPSHSPSPTHIHATMRWNLCSWIKTESCYFSFSFSSESMHKREKSQNGRYFQACVCACQTPAWIRKKNDWNPNRKIALQGFFSSSTNNQGSPWLHGVSFRTQSNCLRTWIFPSRFDHWPTWSSSNLSKLQSAKAQNALAWVWFKTLNHLCIAF